ncbi:MAG: aspartate aminotransferase family protein [Candidatus Binatia bacterium]|nr:aspartate aminotransferase family protein [Candidatus Binatia bacterium]
MDRTERELARLDRAHLVHGFGSPAQTDRDGTVRLVKGRGIHVWDSEGRRYVDGVSSLWNVNVGHGRPEIARAISQQTRAIEYAPTLIGFSSEPAIRLAARIAKMAPKGLNRVMFTGGGSESNETVIRLVRLLASLSGKPGKVGIVALTRAYHGSSTGAASLTGLESFHRHYEPLMEGVFRMARPDCYRCELGKTYPQCALACADELERLVEREGADRIGAFICEPVQGVGGVIPPPAGWLARIREICDRHDILLVADEVITGFGRLGRNFGVQAAKVVPDMIAFAKGVTSGYVPLGGVILHERLYQIILDAGEDFVLHHGYTYSGHPVACAAGLANLDVLEAEDLIPGVRRKSKPFARALAGLSRHPIVGGTRTAGLMGAVELVRDRDSREPFADAEKVPWRVRQAALRRGVLLRAGLSFVVVCPPFVITDDQIDDLIGRLDEAIAEVQAELGYGSRPG